MLNALAKKLVGVDISGLSVHAANFRHNGLHGARATVRHLPFADDTFHVIVSNSTLDHFESSDEFVASLRELHRVLRVGGQLLLTLDNLSNPVIASRSLLPYRFLNRSNIVPYYVGTTFEPHRLCRSIEHLGFGVLEVQAIMHFPRIFTMLLCRVPERLIMNSAHKRFLHLLMSFEHMSCWPTRFLTGYFVSVRATKR